MNASGGRKTGLGKAVLMVALSCAFAVLAVSPSLAAAIDFESVPGVGVPTEGLLINTQYQASEGVSFSLEGGDFPRIAEVGCPRTALGGPPNHSGCDNPAGPEQGIGRFFLTDDGVLSGLFSPALIVTYSPPTAEASGVILDLDFDEFFTIELRDSMGGILDTIVLTAGDPGTGDGIATPWSFTRTLNDVYSIRFKGQRTQSGAFGLGFDNFDARRASTECPDPDPHTQGYWHRQCLGVPASEGGIDPGRNGRGPSSPNEPGFVDDLMPCADAKLENLGFYGTPTCVGMDADPPSDPCERALKQLTAMVLNVCSGRLENGCAVDTSPEGCTSGDVGDLIDEVTSMIHAGDCVQAAECAGAVNEGAALVSDGGGASSTDLPDTTGTGSAELKPIRKMTKAELNALGIRKVSLGVRGGGNVFYLVPAGFFDRNNLPSQGEAYFLVSPDFDPNDPGAAKSAEPRTEIRQRKKAERKIGKR